MIPTRALYSLMAPAGRRSRLSIMIFHRVLHEPDPLRPGEPTAAEFEARMRWAKAHFNVLPLPEAIARLRDGTLPARPLAITFDDGYRDNHDIALPILQRLGLHATFFVATRYLDGGCMFNDVVIEAIRQAPAGRLDLEALRLGVHDLTDIAGRREAIAQLLPTLKPMPVEARADLAASIARAAGATVPSDLMMSSAQVAALSRAGMEVGAHTDAHPILAACEDRVAREEIARGRTALESIVGHRVGMFAYPNGRPRLDYGRAHVAMVREMGFDGAVSTAWGVSSAGSDPFQLPRFTPWDRNPLRTDLRMLGNLRRTAYETV